ncbi:MAG: glycosyltransferase [Vicinamibacteria bacterium]|nr:glycosyltransferase [Vicinamibacteria bacterium]
MNQVTRATTRRFDPTREARRASAIDLRSRKRAVVTPVGNERQQIDQAVERMRTVAARYDPFGLVWLTAFNDFCRDGTYEHLRDLSEAPGFEWLRVIRLDRTTSLARAYLAGYAAALRMGCDLIAEADIGHPYDKLPALFDGLDRAPVVFGTRYGRDAGYKGAWIRRLLSRTGALSGRLLLGLRMRDGTGGFYAFRRTVLEQIPLDRFLSTGHMFQTEMKRYCCRLDFVEIGFQHEIDQSSLDWRSFREAPWILVKLMAVSPVHPEAVSCRPSFSYTCPRPEARRS